MLTKFILVAIILLCIIAIKTYWLKLEPALGLVQDEFNLWFLLLHKTINLSRFFSFYVKAYKR